MSVKAQLVQLMVKPLYFDLIRTERKVVEGRLKKPSLDSIKIHQVIHFISSIHIQNKLEARVTYLKTYLSFREMLHYEGLDRCLPGVRTLEEGINIYYGFPSYREDEKRYGVLAIGFQLIKG